MEKLVEIDRAWTLALNAFNSPVSDRIWIFFSDKLIWSVLYLAVLYFFFRELGWKRALVALGCCILMVVCCDQLSNLVKDAVGRIRPCNDEWMLAHGLHVLETAAPDSHGFFSAHAANSFGFAACSAGCFKWKSPARKYTALILVWATLVSISRIFVAKHFLGDVFVGAIVGLVIGYAISLLGGWLCRRAFSYKE